MATAHIDLLLTPNRSWTPRNTLTAIGGVAGVFFLGALRLLVLGAWPVLPFMAIDLGLLAWAFRASRRASEAWERVHLADGLLEVRRGSRGAESCESLEPAHARVRFERTSALKSELWLEAHGRRIPIGGLLTTPERESVAAALRDGLERWRGRRR